MYNHQPTATTDHPFSDSDDSDDETKKAIYNGKVIGTNSMSPHCLQAKSTVDGSKYNPDRLTLEQVQYSGILDSIPKKTTRGDAPSTADISDSCSVCKELIDIGYDIRLGEAGRATLKREISRRLKESVQLRDLCVSKVCRLKNANVVQLIQMSELTGCLLLVRYCID
eukprot:Protomagalhaensia_sp_Gyna_25__1675@NODE_1873_length_1458_cov_121_541931_g1541_i0_p1_GENE_NODE_1873_length_1458_cov_121_541931_g1541_i0NODE_1873_length_1458_cov_121_541931_g1541_i0_p1_ORF_typecomplete_len182_score11_95Ggamma/PF00631_22/4_4e03Ggamma/PF00631_22/0_58_NODE_1873_length_1458_cov_121_541931_g1541_i09111414